MKKLKKSAIGATDLPSDLLLTAPERVLIEARYSLEWVPGALTGQYGGTPLYLNWLSHPDQGSWLVLPIEPHGLHIATALIRELGRPLIYHVANCFYERGRSELGVVSYEMQLNGEKRPRSTGLETKDPDELTEGSGEDRLRQLIRLMIVLPDSPTVSQYQFPVFKVSEGSSEANDAEPSGDVSEDRLHGVLTLLRRPNSRAVRRRDGQNSFVVDIEGAENYPMHVYMNHATAEALVALANDAGLRMAARPTVRGHRLLEGDG